MMYGLDTYDYGARQYNPIVPTWDRIDPLCEQFGYMTPYSYCLDNPVNTTDKDGKGPIVGAVIGGSIELASQLIESYDTNKSILDNLSQNVNWTNVAIAAGEGALTSGVSALSGLGTKMAVSAVSSAAKEVSSQVKAGAVSYKQINYAKIGKNSFIDALTTGISGKIAIIRTNKKFKNIKAKPTPNATMHRRAGQMRYNKSTRRNARKRLQKEKNAYSDKQENIINIFLNSSIGFLKRYGLFN